MKYEFLIKWWIEPNMFDISCWIVIIKLNWKLIMIEKINAINKNGKITGWWIFTQNLIGTSNWSSRWGLSFRFQILLNRCKIWLLQNFLTVIWFASGCMYSKSYIPFLWVVTLLSLRHWGVLESTTVWSPKTEIHGLQFSVWSH